MGEVPLYGRAYAPTCYLGDVATYRGTSLIRSCPPPKDHNTSLGTGLLQGTTGGVFLMSQVPLYSPLERCRNLRDVGSRLEGAVAPCLEHVCCMLLFLCFLTRNSLKWTHRRPKGISIGVRTTLRPCMLLQGYLVHKKQSPPRTLR